MQSKCLRLNQFKRKNKNNLSNGRTNLDSFTKNIEERTGKVTKI